LLLASAPLAAADWPQFRGPDGQGVAADKQMPTQWSAERNVAWKIELPGAGTSSPIVVGDRMYLTCYSGYNVPGDDAGSMEKLVRHVIALNRQSGKLLWKTDHAAKLPEQDRIRDGHGYASSTLASDGERLYAFFGKSGVLALDLAGKTQWQADVGSGLNGWGSAASPVLHGNLVIINASVESDSVVALDKRTGREVWRAGGIKESWNTPILVQTPAGKTELVLAIQGKVLGLDPASGEQLWSCDTDIPWYMVPSLVAHEGVVYCIGGRGGGGALAVRTGGSGDVTDSHRLWHSNKGSNVSSPIYHQGHLYWAHESQGILYCADAKTGKVLYEERLSRPDQFYSSPVLADGKIYYVGRGGRTFVVAAQPKYELLANNEPLERSTFNACPIVADGRLLLRSDKALWCID
jgi:outer membrane protein assembly factor BamB